MNKRTDKPVSPPQPVKEPVAELVDLTEEEQRQVGGGMTDRGDTYSLAMTDRGVT